MVPRPSFSFSFGSLLKNFVEAQRTSWRALCARRYPRGNSNHPKTRKCDRHHENKFCSHTSKMSPNTPFCPGNTRNTRYFAKDLANTQKPRIVFTCQHDGAKNSNGMIQIEYADMRL